MSEAKAEILSRIRSVLGGNRDAPEVPRAYLHTSGVTQGELVEQFAERASDYRATVHRTTEAGLRGAVGKVCDLRGAETLVAPADVPDAWLPDGVALTRDTGLSYTRLERFGGVLTGCALAVAQTGTIVLDGGPLQGRRAVTLLPDLHLCVIFGRQIVGTVPEAVAALEGRSAHPLTFISGPSATSDIELSRVEGVHGPRTLDLILVGA